MNIKFYFLTFLLVLSSCNPEFYKVIPAKTTNGEPTKLRLIGASSIFSQVCNEYTVERLTAANTPSVVSSSTLVNLTPRTNGSFHLVNDCSDSAITTVSIDSGNSSKIIYYKNIGTGVYDLLAEGLTTPASLNVTITTGTPEFSFSQESFSLTEANVAVGTAVTIRRSIPGLSQSISINGTDLTTSPGEVTLSTQVVNFAPADLSKVVIFPLPGPMTDFKGDRFFKVKLSAPSPGSVLGERDEAVVNVLENSIAPKFYFPQPLYTAHENAGTVTIRIQRKGGDPVIPETINLTTINGSASSPANYLMAGPQTITFNPGETEKTATISIVDNALQGDSKSFFIELKSPTVGEDLITRPWSTAKVRILDNDDTTICDPSITGAFGGGLGTQSSPFLICSVTQLDFINSDATKYYKIMSDLDLQGFNQIATHFEGVLDGNERVLKNFVSMGAGSRGFMASMGNSFPSLISIINLNLTQALVYSNNFRAGGFVAEAWDNYHTMSSNLFSGLVYSTDGTGGLIGRTIASKDSADINNISHGTVYGSSAGGLMGLTHNTDTPTIWLHQSYSTAFVFGTGSVGGLLGNYDYSHGRLEITNSHAKGFITGAGSPADSDHYAGGLIGSYIAQDDSSVMISASFYEGVVSKATRSGGLIGRSSTYDDDKSYALTLTNNRVHAQVEARGDSGGLIGRMATNVDVNMYDNEVVVALTDDVSVLTSGDYISHGGLIGYINASGDPEITIENLFLSNKNTITAITRGHKAGVVGGIAVDDTTRVSLRNIDYSGTINSPEGQGVSGIVGSIRQNTNSSSVVTFSDVHHHGSITGRSSVGGILGQTEMWEGTPSILARIDIEDSSVPGSVTGLNDHIGGVVGNVYQQASTRFVVKNTFSSGAINGTNRVGGIMGSNTIEDGTDSRSIILNSSSRGSLNSTAGGATFMGGLVGIYHCHEAGDILIDQSYNSATLTSTGEDVGGLVDGMEIQDGACQARITNSYSSGTIDSAEYTTGLVAYYKFETANGGAFRIEDSYSSSRILNPTGAGMEGLVQAWMPSDLVVLDNSFFVQESGYNDLLPVQSYGIPVASFASVIGTYGWNPTIWELKAGKQFPTLISNPEP